MSFFIGDRVRLLHTKDEGVIVKLIDDQTVEVAIDSDFDIPVLKKELTLISAQETQLKNLKTPQTSPTALPNPVPNAHYPAAEKPKMVLSLSGLYLALVEDNRNVDFYLMNNTDVQVPFALYSRSAKEIQRGELKGLFTGILEPKQALKVHQNNLETLNQWESYLIEGLFFHKGFHIHQKPMLKHLVINQKVFDAKPIDVPMLRTKARLIQLDEDVEQFKADIELLKEKLFEPNQPTIIQKQSDVKIIKTIPDVIDLHIETLQNDWELLDKSQILGIQMAYFIKMLDTAIVQKFEKITFIHGVGNGVLKNEIQKRLAKNIDYVGKIRTFKDAQKEKFGYGATEIHLR